MALSEEIGRLAAEFADCRQLLLAIGNETRQHIILKMLQIEDCRGVRVGAITERTHLSRPAVSHHIRILKDAGILKVRREKTMNYYYFDTDTAALDRLGHVIERTKEIMSRLPDRSGADCEVRKK